MILVCDTPWTGTLLNKSGFVCFESLLSDKNKQMNYR
jgi:hypothetical protein